MKKPLRVAVVGGGWAGLAAAVELCAAGVDVTLFEASRELGGRARRVTTHGHVLDNGQHILIGAYRETLRLMRRVGANPEQHLKRLPLELDYPGTGFRLKLPKLPAPLHLAVGLFTARGCSFAEKISAIRFMRALQACNYQLATDCSVAEWLDQHRQSGGLRHHLWEALSLAALNTAAENASAQLLANVLRDSLGGTRADTDLLLPATDLGEVFPDAAAEFIRTHGGTIQRATRIDPQHPLLAKDGGTFDHLILAVASCHAATWLAQQPATAAIAERLAAYAYEPIGTVYIGYPPAFRLPRPMLGLDNADGKKLGQWVFDRGALCQNSPRSSAPGTLSFVLSAHGAWDEHDDATLVRLLHHELQAALGIPLPQPLWHQVIRERRATFSCRPGLPRPASETPIPGLWLAGDYVCADYPATLEGAVRSGVTAARRILATPQHTPDLSK